MYNIITQKVFFGIFTPTAVMALSCVFQKMPLQSTLHFFVLLVVINQYFIQDLVVDLKFGLILNSVSQEDMQVCGSFYYRTTVSCIYSYVLGNCPC